MKDHFGSIHVAIMRSLTIPSSPKTGAIGSYMYEGKECEQHHLGSN